MRVFLLIVALLALAGCQPKQIYVSDGYVRLAAVPRHPAAAYFTLHGGTTDATLISVSSETAIKTEMHESMQKGSVASMKPLDQLTLPAAIEGRVRARRQACHAVRCELERSAGQIHAASIFTFALTDCGSEYDPRP